MHHNTQSSALQVCCRGWGLERVTGIEPVSSAWKAVALPLSYTRKVGPLAPIDLLVNGCDRSDRQWVSTQLALWIADLKYVRGGALVHLLLRAFRSTQKKGQAVMSRPSKPLHHHNAVSLEPFQGLW